MVPERWVERPVVIASALGDLAPFMLLTITLLATGTALRTPSVAALVRLDSPAEPAPEADGVLSIA